VSIDGGVRGGASENRSSRWLFREVGCAVNCPMTHCSMQRLNRRVMRYALLNLTAVLSVRVEREQTAHYRVIYAVRAAFAKIFYSFSCC
jgi:hypothetical protein